ncbi:hypothetical protein QGN29_02595 [Temperatibacter marinus]|uniref:Methylamine utilization protein n=1 Tax=Temperatibacter marinus TaxID=1456591 RepID=A0AA52ED50_9PROT|nr:hypothetical protein [Temperatibacter marinus]WND03257.1 hypothetical protein QGN29_02595 [Temperatibacter marinus]
MRQVFISFLLLFSIVSSAEDLTVRVTGADQKALPHSVVSLKPLSGQEFSRVDLKKDMTQQQSLFTPFILAVQKGQKVQFPNKDPFRHHVYSFSKAKSFELRLYGEDEEKHVVFEKAGVVALGCNIHDNMLAFVYVTEDPVYQKTNAEGSTSFKGLPEGDYEMTVWHVDQKSRKPYKKMITVNKQLQALSVEITIKKRRQIQKKRNASGGIY